MLEVIKFFHTVDAITDEQKLHRKYSEFRVHGEWFNFEFSFEYVDPKLTHDDIAKMVFISDRFSSWTNNIFLMDAMDSFKTLGADIKNKYLKSALKFFAYCTLEKQRYDMFWTAIEEDIPMLVTDLKFENPTGIIIGYLSGMMNVLKECDYKEGLLKLEREQQESKIQS